MNVDGLLAIISDTFGGRATVISTERAVGVVSCVLYDTFVFTCGLNGEHGTFTGGIEYAKGRYITRFLGKHLSFNTDRESIVRSLEIVDEYCRLRLPEKFLVTFDDGR